MPFYEYQCSACGAQVEVLQKITDAPLSKCPECGRKKLRKLVSAPVFRLKGGGWYETDFKTDKDNKRNLVGAESGETKVEDKPAAKEVEKSETKAEAKPEAKAETKAEPRSETGSKAPVRAKPLRKKAAGKPPRRKGMR